jgi:hypothetical protein
MKYFFLIFLLFLAGVLFLPSVTTAQVCGGSGWAFYESPDCPGGDLPSSYNRYITCQSTETFSGSWKNISCFSTGGLDWWYSGSCSYSSACATPVCTPSWSCTAWSLANSSCGTSFTQTRTCTDSNSCGTTSGKPSESQTATGTYCSSGWTCSGDTAILYNGTCVSGSCETSLSVDCNALNGWYSSGLCTEAYRDYTCSGVGSCGSYSATSTRNKADGTSCGVDLVCSVGSCVPILTYSLNTWQRLWYNDPKTNNFSGASYLGQDTVADINKDWGTAQLYSTTAAGTDNGTSRIGFKASRTLTGLTPGAYTISVGADDGIKLFVNGGGNLLPASAWSDNHSWDKNRHTVRVELGSTATVEIHYRENTGDAKITFAYAAGFTDVTQEFECLWGISCGGPAGLWSHCDARVKSDGYCYYNGTGPAGCFADPPPSSCSARGACTYQSRCIVQSGQTCTNLGCVEGTPPTVTINTASGQWKNANPILDIDFSDNVALSSVGYKVGSGGTWRVPTTNGTTSISVSGASYTAEWRITNDDWNSMGQGESTIYVRAQDTSGNPVGYDGTKSFTIKKDSLAPSSTLNVAGAKTGTDSAGRHWFNVGKSISVEDKDNETPGAGKFSGLDTASCYYRIQDLGRPTGAGNPTSGVRTCGSAVSVTVGPSNSGAVCQTQDINPATGRGYCFVYVHSYDLAGNLGSRWEWLNIDYTAPGAQ